MSNLRIWDAVSKTDPKHTKPVEFGRKFTSIDAHWQIMQATKQFGPVGQGWGYTVAHSVERLAETMVLAVADVTLWWRTTEGLAEVRHTYGPLRATCEMWSKNEKKGRMEVDEDAPKKAMTDALTKGLSHLGFSADVFLGLFDDNRYVQRMRQEFANNGNDEPQPERQRVGNSQEPRGLQHVDPGDRHLVQGDGRSTYQLNTGDKGPGRLAAELLASNAIGVLKMPGMDLVGFNEWKAEKCTPKGTKTNGDRLAEMREKHPDLAQKVDEAVDLLRVAA